MEVMLARLDAIRRRGVGALPELRAAFAAASATLQVGYLLLQQPSKVLSAPHASPGPISQQAPVSLHA